MEQGKTAMDFIGKKAEKPSTRDGVIKRFMYLLRVKADHFLTGE